MGVGSERGAPRLSFVQRCWPPAKPQQSPALRSCLPAIRAVHHRHPLLAPRTARRCPSTAAPMHCSHSTHTDIDGTLFDMLCSAGIMTQREYRLQKRPCAPKPTRLLGLPFLKLTALEHVRTRFGTLIHAT